MGTYTTNYNLFMPSLGEQGWGNLVNGNFTTIDTTMKSLSNSIGTLETETDAVEERVNVLEGSLDNLDCSSVTTNTIHFDAKESGIVWYSLDGTIQANYKETTTGNTFTIACSDSMFQPTIGSKAIITLTKSSGEAGTLTVYKSDGTFVQSVSNSNTLQVDVGNSYYFVLKCTGTNTIVYRYSIRVYI